jgi:predicted murein hydrolase (TIGR00659 family)
MFSTTLFAMALTLVVYELAEMLFRFSRQNSLLNPLLTAVAVIILVLKATGVSYDTYFAGSQFIHFMLGPATVALAVPLYEQRERVKRSLLPLSVATVSGSITSIAIAGIMLKAGHVERSMLISVLPKSVTTPIAMGIVERLGGLPTLTAVMVLITGIFGGITVPPLLRIAAKIIGQRSVPARGYAMGMSSHGIGTARAFQESNEMGAFSGLAIGLHGLVTAVLVPILLHWFV